MESLRLKSFRWDGARLEGDFNLTKVFRFPLALIDFITLPILMSYKTNQHVLATD